MSSRRNKLAFDSPERAYLLCVLHDDEFQQRAERIRNAINSKKLEVSESIFRTALSVGGKELVREDKVLKSIEDLAWDFDLSVRHAASLINGEVPPENLNMKGPVGVFTRLEGEDGGPMINIIVGEGANKADILTAIEGIEDDIKRVYGSYKRAKYPENYQLIYAIHRARRKGLKFSEIFKMYSLGKLDNYSGSRSINSPSKFTEYYRKYEPMLLIPVEETGIRPPSDSDGPGISWVLDADVNNAQSEVRKKHVKKSGTNPRNIPHKDTP